MLLREEFVQGQDYLDLVTTLLHRVRTADPTSGMWEAADLQWWWRRARASDDHGQLFWTTGQREPVAAVILTDWGRGRPWQCDVISMPDCDEEQWQGIWARALSRMEELPLDAVEITVCDDDAMLLAAVEKAGFEPTGEIGASSWLQSGQRLAVSPLPDGFRLLSRTETNDRPHHMIARNGADVAERLAQCSLYEPELDLLVEAADGTVAAYGLFWADPVTGVGLVEPMRTEEQYWRRGLARHVLTTGLDRLATRGCTRLKVSSDLPLYLVVGFTPLVTDTTFVRRTGSADETRD
ncbi:MAG: GNAT family N-acetyltransferase [Nocardioidaceae bacterium]